MSSVETLWETRQERLRNVKRDLDVPRWKFDHRRQPTPPGYLGRLKTPPEHKQLHGNKNLRRSKYPIVPDVTKNVRVTESDSDDSWGDDDDDDDGLSGDDNVDDSRPQYVQHNPYLLPGAGYPAPGPMYLPHPGVMYPAQPLAIYYPQGLSAGMEPVRKSNRKPRAKTSKDVHYGAVSKNKVHSWQPLDEKGVQFAPHRRHRQSAWTETCRESVICDASEQMVDEDVEEFVVDIVRQATTELAQSYLSPTCEPDPLEAFLSDLLDDAVHGALNIVVKETISDMSDDVIMASITHDVIGEILNEGLDDFVTDLVSDVIFEHAADSLIEEDIVWPEISADIREVVEETVQHYDNRVRRREYREISQLAGGRVIDELCLDHLLSTVAKQGRLLTEAEHLNKLIDHLSLNILLEQLFDVRGRRSVTLDNVALAHLHKKAVINVGVDVLLSELCSVLDEDMADLDEYERGVTEPHSTNNHR